MDLNHPWDRPLSSLGIKPYSPSFRYAALWSISDKPPLDNLPWYNGSCLPTLASACSKSYQLNSYSRNELESGKSGIEGRDENAARARGRVRSRWLDWGAVKRVKDGGGRANVCPSERWILAPLPSHYSLHSDWITYNQHQTFLNSISCTRNRVFSRFFCVMKPLWEVRGLYSAKSPRDDSVPYSYYVQMCSTEHAGNRYIVIAISLSLFLSSSFSLRLRQIRIDIFVKEFLGYHIPDLNVLISWTFLYAIVF